MPKGVVCPEIPIQQPGPVLTTVTHKSLTVWSHIMDHQNSEKVTYQNGIRDFQSFGLSETSAAVLSRTEFSSDIDHQNSITSKPLRGQGHMSNGYKTGTVAQDIGVQLQDRILMEPSHFRFFLTVVFTFLR
jgi:hypothetical protein